MAGEWVEKSIGEIAEVVGGSTPSTRDLSNFDGDIPWLTPKDLASPHPRYVHRGERNLSRKGLESCSAQLLPANSVLLSSRAPIGYLAIAANPLATNQGFRSLVVKPDYDHEYVYYWLLANIEELERHATGSTFKELSGSSLKQIRIQLPADRGEQRAIAHILGTLDDKIELNRRMSETLERMARALFKAWFVDFDPVRAKIEGRWKRGQSLPGLPAHLYDLFPDRLVDSELGEIPEGWEITTLGNHIDAVKGVSYKGSGLGDSGLPLHNLNSVYEGGGYKYEGIKYYAGEYAERHVVRPGDVIVANTEQGHDRLLIGYAAIVPSLFGDRGIASHHIYRLRPKPTSTLTPRFLCHLLNSPQMHDIVSGYANGTTVNMLPIDGVQKPEILCPPQSLVTAFDSLASSAEQRREAMVLESHTLAALRDALLPKLISGELRVKDAERFLKERGL
ncbi:MAG: restriction endonuclease subunit S [Rubrobacteraceae bacterium]|nr:restriction endonuclease subunit S [Rubrobacteraceae bacterium]